MAKMEITEKIFDALSDSPISFYRLCRRTKLHQKTVKRYLALIQYVQSKEKIEIEREGFRVLIIKRNKSK